MAGRAPAVLALAACMTGTAAAAAGAPVQVYILMGQSNMLGMGKVAGADTNGTLEYAVRTEGKYPYLLDPATGGWAVSETVRNIFVQGSGNQTFARASVKHNEFMTVAGGGTIGPELGIGHALAGKHGDAPVMLLKSCIGNRALGWDLLPPGSEGFDYTDAKGVTYRYAGYHESPNRWVKGEIPQPIGWMAGEQYDGDVDRAHQVLKDLPTYYPGATAYKVAGFFWWQGDKDRGDVALAERYERNLVRLIDTLRTTFNAPEAKFVTATPGQTEKGATSPDGKILDAMFAVDGASGKYPAFAGNVAAVYTHPVSLGGASNSHYNGNAETYMNVGEAMGAAMVDLL